MTIRSAHEKHARVDDAEAVAATEAILIGQRVSNVKFDDASLIEPKTSLNL